MHTSQTQRGETQTARRVMAYCHDSVGIGHLRRTLNICERVGHRFPDACFLLATGTPYVQLFRQNQRLDCVKLPALCKVDNCTYRPKYLKIPTERLLYCRKAMLLQTAACFVPDVLLVDKAPLGVCRELLPTIEWLRENHPATRIIFGMRDIEDAPEATIAQWRRAGVTQILESCFDEIWVYGKPEVFDVVEHYRLSPRIQRKLRFMGYVCHEPCDHPQRRNGRLREVVVTVGGGTDGEQVLSTYLSSAASRAAAMGVTSTVVGGPDLPREVASRLADRCAGMPGVTWLDFEPCMSCRLRSAELVVSMGGYNTMCELAVHGRPALIIPRVKPRLEQAIRAEIWSRRADFSVLTPSALTPAALSARVLDLLKRPATPRSPRIDVGGLDRVEQRFEALWSEEPVDATAVRV